MDKEICANCKEPKWKHYEVPTIEGEKKIFECQIVRDSGKNYRFRRLNKNKGR